MRARLLVVALMVVLLASACSDGGDANTSSSPTTTVAAQGRRFRLIAPEGLATILARERRLRRRDERTEATSTTVAPTTTTLAPATAPFAVATFSHTFIDSTRGTPARGGNAEAPSRTIVATIYYPTPAAVPNAPPVVGPFPLLVFAHGYEIDAAAYAPLIQDLAAGGYVVAAPDFPGTSTAYSGGAIRSDSLEEPADISFVITSTIALAGTPGPLFGMVDPSAVGDAGQSDGGVVAAAAAYTRAASTHASRRARSAPGVRSVSTGSGSRPEPRR